MKIHNRTASVSERSGPGAPRSLTVAAPFGREMLVGIRETGRFSRDSQSGHPYQA
jgi:hypothetical protein